jgi:hypothetical protein
MGALAGAAMAVRRPHSPAVAPGAFGGCIEAHVGAKAADGRGEVNAVDRVPAVADTAENGGIGAAALA